MGPESSSSERRRAALVVAIVLALGGAAFAVGALLSGDDDSEVVVTQTQPTTAKDGSKKQKEEEKKGGAEDKSAGAATGGPCSSGGMISDLRVRGGSCAEATTVANQWQRNQSRCSTIDDPDSDIGYRRTCTVSGYRCTAKRDTRSDRRFVTCTKGSTRVAFTHTP